MKSISTRGTNIHKGLKNKIYIFGMNKKSVHFCHMFFRTRHIDESTRNTVENIIFIPKIQKLASKQKSHKAKKFKTYEV